MKQEQYINEIKALLEAYGAPELSRLLNTTERAIAYWTAEKERKTPRRETVQKIHELFLNIGVKKNGQEPNLTRVEAKIDVLFDVAVELLSATSGESSTLIRKKLEKRVDELKRFSGE